MAMGIILIGWFSLTSLKQWRQNMCVVDMKLRPNTFMCVGVIIITTQRFLYIQRIYAILKCVNHKLTSTTHLCKKNMYVVQKYQDQIN